MEGRFGFGSTAQMTTEWASDGGVVSNGDGTAVEGWETSNVVSNTASNVIIDAEYQLTGAETTIPLELFLECSTDNDSSCDYYDTESISFTLPDDVTYTSASGMFLNQHVASTPEPGTLVLFATALVGLGWSLRRRGRLR